MIELLGPRHSESTRLISRPDKLNHWSLILLKTVEDVGSRPREEVSSICRLPIHSSNSPQKRECWLLISGVSEPTENNTGATKHKAKAFFPNVYPPAGIRWDLLPTAHSIPSRVSRIDIQQYLSDGKILCGNIGVYPPLIQVGKRLFFGIVCFYILHLCYRFTSQSYRCLCWSRKHW